VGNPSTKKVAMITTAAEEKENNQYSKLAKDQLEKMGFAEIRFVDIETEVSPNLDNYDVIYVCGGNTFKLLKYSRESNFKKTVVDLMSRGGIYVGVSAGSLLVGPSIQIAGEIEPDTNEVGLTDFSGLNLTDEIIFPHYEPHHEKEILEFESKNKVKVTRLTNNQALLVGASGNLLVE
jgi:dipeptidase E